MHRVLILAALAVTLIVAGCGGNNSSDQAATGATTSDTVGVKPIDGFGRVLVDSSGMALYTPHQEANGKVRCTGACTSEWQPVNVDGKPTSAPGAGRVGVIKRPDGARQVTLNGMPLYTFVQDSPSQITGDGFNDQFDGTDFTWHVVLAGGVKGAGNATDTSGQYGY